MRTRNNRKKRRIIIAICICVFLVIIGCLGAVGMFALNSAKALKRQATETKTQLDISVNCIKAQDYDGAYTAINNAEELSRSMQAKFDEPIWKILSINSSMKKNIAAGKELMDILETASQDVIKPLITQMSEYPMSNLKDEDGFNVGTLLSYVDFADELDPKMNSLVLRIDDLLPRIDNIVNLIDKDGKLVKYKDMMMGLSTEYNELREYLPVFRTVLGNGENRFYLLAAQNSTEIRAGGGFPGSIGTIKIQDGHLKVGDFQTVYDVLPYATPAKAEITETEKELFNNWMKFPRDAGYNPDFGRTAYIWALSYSEKNKVDVDGVISMAPTIIQDMLALCGEVTLSDGTVINKDNATKILQHDLYFKYFPKNSATVESNEIADALFAETAKKTMELFESKFNFKDAKDYFSIFSKGAQNRSIMLWMEDEKEEELMVESECSGVLNTGENNAVAGVYFSCNDPQKLGWFLDLNTEVSDAVVHEDGTRTYNVKVILNNTISNEELSVASGYILGSYNGAMKGFVHLFAPVGGTISDYATSNNMRMEEANYQGLQLGYCLNMRIYPNEPVEITYKVTTAADVTEPLTISSTPTLQSYR
jgi:hypothetical protein